MAGPTFNGAVTGPSTGYTHYPQNLNLSDSSEEAIAAAFAEYDDSFQYEMDQWMEMHGPDPGDEQYNSLAESNHHQDVLRDENLTLRGEDDAVINQERTDNDKEDMKFRQAAIDIVQKIDTAGKSLEVQQKLNNSSFVELMKRVSNREVVLKGETLIDTTTGMEINLGDSASVDNQGDNIADANTQQLNDNKGKGKAFEVEDVADQSTQGGSSA